MSREVLAALDIGSNSAHLLVAEVVPPAHIRRVATHKTQLRLAESVVAEGRFGPAVRRKVLGAVSELVAVARKRGATELVVVATDALRHAADGGEVGDALVADMGVRVRVLEGLEEAALSLRGIAAALRVTDGLLGLDLGGGSLEIARGDGGHLRAGASLPLGSARVSSRLTHDPPPPAELSALRAEALSLLRPAADEVLGTARGSTLLSAATAGTVRDLARLGLALSTGSQVQRVRGLVVTREQLQVALDRLVALPARERKALPGISESRVDILPGGGVVTLAAMEALGLETLTLCDWGLREGALLDALTAESVLSRRDFSAL